MVEADYRHIVARTQSGRQLKAVKGGWPGGPAPYGYRISGKGAFGSILEVDPAEVVVGFSPAVESAGRRRTATGDSRAQRFLERPSSAAPISSGAAIARGSTAMDGLCTARAW